LKNAKSPYVLFEPKNKFPTLPKQQQLQQQPTFESFDNQLTPLPEQAKVIFFLDFLSIFFFFFLQIIK